MIEAAEIERMSKTERIQAMELLWNSLSSNPSELESPGWHGEVLAQRLAKVEAGDGEFLTIAQLKERLNRRGA
jgi:putative addiction module component (TIGR02574 family)